MASAPNLKTIVFRLWVIILVSILTSRHSQSHLGHIAIFRGNWAQLYFSSKNGLRKKWNFIWMLKRPIFGQFCAIWFEHPSSANAIVKNISRMSKFSKCLQETYNWHRLTYWLNLKCVSLWSMTTGHVMCQLACEGLLVLLESAFDEYFVRVY